MERLFKEKKESKNQSVLLQTTQRMHTEYGEDILHSQTLKQGSVDDIKLIRTKNHTVRFNEGHISKGYGLESSILITTGKQNFFVFDSDHLNYPYLAYAFSKGWIDLGGRFVSVDAHIDIYDTSVQSPKIESQKDLPGALKHFENYIWESSFISALVESGLVYEVNCLSWENPYDIGSLISGKRCKSAITLRGGEFNWEDPRDKIKPSLFENCPILAIDLDFFGIASALENYLNQSGTTPLKEAEKFTERLRGAGYKSDLVPVVCIATSPGYNQGFENEEEKIVIAKHLVDTLSS